MDFKKRKMENLSVFAECFQLENPELASLMYLCVCD